MQSDKEKVLVKCSACGLEAPITEMFYVNPVVEYVCIDEQECIARYSAWNDPPAAESRRPSMTDRERLGDEGYVRSRYDTPVLLHDTTTNDRGYGLLLGQKGIWPGTEHWNIVWKAAADYTEAHEQKIREREEEIQWMNDIMDGLFGNRSEAVRILAQLESQLAELRKGMKG